MPPDSFLQMQRGDTLFLEIDVPNEDVRQIPPTPLEPARFPYMPENLRVIGQNDTLVMQSMNGYFFQSRSADHRIAMQQADFWREPSGIWYESYCLVPGVVQAGDTVTFTCNWVDYLDSSQMNGLSFYDKIHLIVGQ